MTHCVYRHYSNDGKLLYVGVSAKPLLRTDIHKNKSEWFKDIRYITIEHCESKLMALEVERAAISIERPLFNERKKSLKQTIDKEKCSYNQYLDLMGKRKAEIIELYKSGKTYAEIGFNFGISRQRVEQIINSESE